MSTPLSHAAPCWCRATYCTRQVFPGNALCATHAAMLAKRAPRGVQLLEALEGVDPRGIECRITSWDTVHCLERIADAVEALAQLEGHSVVNLYRLRANLCRTILARAEPAPVQVQARLLEQHPDLGAYGPEGRAR
jgi:hypothetical protein